MMSVRRPDQLGRSGQDRHAIDSPVLRDIAGSLRVPWPFPATAQYGRIADLLATRAESTGAMLVAGVCGAQGSGKSTLASFVGALLNARGVATAIMSLDDLYFDREDRPTTIHPLFATRGVPGTHDIGLGEDVLDSLSTAASDAITLIPRFDKALDRRAPKRDWTPFRGPARIVLLEGWCVSTPPQSATDLRAPVNVLEAEEDRDARWRTHVNDCLAGAYRRVFDRVSLLIFLEAPAFACVREWRGRQERKLRERAGPDAAGVMDARQLDRFIQYYERLTRHALAVLPGRADVLLRLDREQRIVATAGLGP